MEFYAEKITDVATFSESDFNEFKSQYNTDCLTQFLNYKFGKFMEDFGSTCIPIEYLALILEKIYELPFEVKSNHATIKIYKKSSACLELIKMQRKAHNKSRKINAEILIFIERQLQKFKYEYLSKRHDIRNLPLAFRETLSLCRRHIPENIEFFELLGSVNGFIKKCIDFISFFQTLDKSRANYYHVKHIYILYNRHNSADQYDDLKIQLSVMENPDGFIQNLIDILNSDFPGTIRSLEVSEEVKQTSLKYIFAKIVAKMESNLDIYSREAIDLLDEKLAQIKMFELSKFIEPEIDELDVIITSLLQNQIQVNTVDVSRQIKKIAVRIFKIILEENSGPILK